MAPCGLEQHLIDTVAIGLQHREQQVLLAGKKVIQAPAVRLRALEHVRNRRRGEALLPEQLDGGENDAAAGILGYKLD